MKTQAIHKGFRNIFLTDGDLFVIFDGRVANTRLPSSMARPYVVLNIKNAATEVYTGGQICDYEITMRIYTTEGLQAEEIANKVDEIFDLVQNLIVDDAKVISCLPTNGDDKIEPQVDLGADVLLNEMNWDLKLFEPTRLTV
jgi:hypothetical protein